MDKYVIRTPRVKEEKQKVVCVEPKKKQTTILALSRVVIVERIHKQKNQLSNPVESVENIIAILKDLEKSIPSKEVLLETKIGHIVNKLRSHSDKHVKNLARRLLKKWKSFYREINSRQAIEVRADLKTEQFRAKARTLISKALKVQTNHYLVDAIEKAVHNTQQSINNVMYRRHIRTICMKLSNDIELRTKVLDGKIKAVSLPAMFSSFGSVT